MCFFDIQLPKVTPLCASHLVVGRATVDGHAVDCGGRAWHLGTPLSVNRPVEYKRLGASGDELHMCELCNILYICSTELTKRTVQSPLEHLLR